MVLKSLVEIAQILMYNSNIKIDSITPPKVIDSKIAISVDELTFNRFKDDLEEYKHTGFYGRNSKYLKIRIPYQYAFPSYETANIAFKNYTIERIIT